MCIAAEDGWSHSTVYQIDINFILYTLLHVTMCYNIQRMIDLVLSQLAKFLLQYCLKITKVCDQNIENKILSASVIAVRSSVH